MTSPALSPADRIVRLLDHLELDQVHVAGCMSGDWGDLATVHGERICSLTIVAPHLNKGMPPGLGASSTPALVVCGERGAPAERGRNLAKAFPNATLLELRDYSSPMWADTVADRADEVSSAIAKFIDDVEGGRGSTARVQAPEEGKVAGLSYRVEGSGPSLLLLPLSLAPSQWSPLVHRLQDRYCTIALGGPHLGVISLLEARGRSDYGRLVVQLVERAGILPGETILEVGSGSGCLVRRVAKDTGRANPIVATEVNRYLLVEAKALAEAERYEDTIGFEEADAEALPYPEARFDAAMACTVLEEGDAGRMLAELSRVTKPNGRVVVVTRALDMPWWVNAPLPTDLGLKINSYDPSTGSGVEVAGCADASLYSRLSDVGMSLTMMDPQFAVYTEGDRLRDVLERFAVPLSRSEVTTFRAGIEQAAAAGTLFVAEPFHCAIGIKR